MGSNDSEPTQAAHGNVVVDRVIQDLTRLVGGSDASRRLMEMDLIYLTDCGGQQAYWDLFPIFMHDTSATLFVHRLCEKLDEHPLNDLYLSGERVGPEERARLTTTQAFKTTLQGLGDKGKRSKIIIVGTHKDLASECEESLSQKNKRLEEIASPHFPRDIVYRNESLDEVIFQVNTRKPDGDDKTEASKIRASIENGATVMKIPIWWFILQQILETLASQLGRAVLSMDECIHVSNTLGFSEGELDAALSFFDKLNVFVYKKYIIPNVVFTNAQVPIDKLSELVKKQYQLKATEADPSRGADRPMTGEWKIFSDSGILTMNILKEFKQHYVDGLFTEEELLRLLQALFVVCPLSPSEYFFPAVLDMTEDSKVIEHLRSSEIAPLVVHFPTGWAPPGVFCCSVCHLQTQAGWEMKKPSKQHDSKTTTGTPRYISRNSIMFTKRGTPGSMTFIDNFSFFAVCVNVDTRKIPRVSLVKHCDTVKSDVLAAVEAGLEITHQTESHPGHTFLCPFHIDEPSSTERGH